MIPFSVSIFIYFVLNFKKTDRFEAQNESSLRGICLYFSLTVPEGSITHPRNRNISTQNPPLPHALYALRPIGVGGWCPSEDALHSGSISTSSAVLTNQKPGDGREIAAVFAARAAPVHRSGAMGDQKVSRSRRNRCS